MTQAVVGPDSRVTAHLRVILEDGTVVEDSYADGKPFTFTMGDGFLDPGLEAVLLGMAPGERRQARLAPGEAFGVPSAANVHTLGRDEFPPEVEVAPGNVVAFETPGGDEVAGTILTVEDDRVEVDFSHPLAGRALGVEAEVVEVC